MAGLLGQAIIGICLSASGQYNQACNKALDASTRQIGIRQDADNIENKSVDIVKNKSTDALGPAPVAIATVGVFSYKIYRQKSLTFKLPDIGVADTISNQITPKSYGLVFTWHW